MGLQFIETERGRQKLCDEEHYIYERHRINPSMTKTYWRCERFYSGCRARIHTIYGSEVPTEIFRSGKHSHPATELEIERRVAVNSMRDAVRAGRGTSTRQIIANASQLLSENGKQQIQNMPTLSRNVQHWRQAALGIPALPPLRTGYEIPDSFKFTKDGDLFLAYDSGVNDADRILMFATESGLNDLAAGAIWACDGTFQVSPNLWTQLFTIHLVIQERSFPRVFALLPNKRESTYLKLFKAIRELRQNAQPESCIIDFEIAVHNAFTIVFETAEVSGCLFHFGQSCWRKICELGKKTQYNTNPSFATKVKCFTALAFLPVLDVADAFELLSDDEDIPIEFVSYFERTYIGVQRGKGIRKRRAEPTFRIEIWNVHNRTKNHEPRTNNPVEGFHSALRASITNAHPNLWVLCTALQAEESLTQTKLAHLRRGDSSQKRKKYKTRNFRLVNLVNQYDSSKMLDFLNAVAVNLR